VNERLTAPLALAAAGLAVLVMALWGFNAFTAPFEDSASSDGSCDAPTAAHRVKRSDITVSVYNAGVRKGRAGATLDLLEEAGFKPGAIGNAPEGTRIRVAVVRTSKEVHPDATLVARALGKQVQVVVVDDDLGPGIDVIIGDRFKQLNPNAPTSVRLPGSAGSC
jgi:hypothetical protein